MEPANDAPSGVPVSTRRPFRCLSLSRRLLRCLVGNKAVQPSLPLPPSQRITVQETHDVKRPPLHNRGRRLFCSGPRTHRERRIRVPAGAGAPKSRGNPWPLLAWHHARFGECSIVESLESHAARFGFGAPFHPSGIHCRRAHHDRARPAAAMPYCPTIMVVCPERARRQATGSRLGFRRPLRPHSFTMD